MMPRHNDIGVSYTQQQQHGRISSGFLSFCPTIVSSYISNHMDSISKVLNHLLMLVILFDVLLFFTSFSVSFLPTIGFNTTTISLLLLSQALLVWFIVNNQQQRFSTNSSILSPTEFKIGLAFGVTVGATILSFMVSHAFRNPTTFCNPLGTSSQNNNMTTDPNHQLRMLQQEMMMPLQQQQSQPVPIGLPDGMGPPMPGMPDGMGPPPPMPGMEQPNQQQQQQQQTPPLPPDQQQELQQQPPPPPPLPDQGQQEQQDLNLFVTTATDFTVECMKRSGSMGAIWLWAGLSFWCNFGICLLLWVGKSELGIQDHTILQYDQVNVNDTTTTTAASSSSQYGSHHQNNQRHNGGIGGGGTFVGDYATVPEIRSDQNRVTGSNSSTVGSSTAINSVATQNSGYGPTGGYTDQPRI